MRILLLIIFIFSSSICMGMEKYHNYRFKIIRNLIKEDKKDRAIDRLKKIYEKSNDRKTRLKAILYLGRIYLSMGEISKAINYFSYFQEKEFPEAFEFFENNLKDGFDKKRFKKIKKEVSPSFLLSLFNEVRLNVEYRNELNVEDEHLEKLRRKALLLVKKKYQTSKSKNYLEKIEKWVTHTKRKKYKSRFFAGGSQNYFSKNFDFVSSSETLPMTYQAYGPKVNVGFSRESFFNGHMFTLSFSSLRGEMSIENDSESSIDYYVKNKLFYAFEASYTYYFRVSENKTKFGVGLDALYLTYTLTQPAELSGFKEDNLALNYLFHFLLEYNYKNYAFFTKNSLVTPGLSLQSELGFKLLF